MRRVSHVVAGLLGGVVLAGCGGAPSASPPPSPTASESSDAPETAPPEPTVPASVRLPGKRGAEAAVSAYVEALNYSSATGDVAPLRGRFADTCSRCAAIADDIATTYADNGRFIGGEWTIDDLSYYGIENGIAVVDAKITYSSQQWIERAGADPVEYPGAKSQLHAFQLSRDTDEWLVGALDPQE